MGVNSKLPEQRKGQKDLSLLEIIANWGRQKGVCVCVCVCVCVRPCALTCTPMSTSTRLPAASVWSISQVSLQD